MCFFQVTLQNYETVVTNLGRILVKTTLQEVGVDKSKLESKKRAHMFYVGETYMTLLHMCKMTPLMKNKQKLRPSSYSSSAWSIRVVFHSITCQNADRNVACECDSVCQFGMAFDIIKCKPLGLTVDRTECILNFR